MKKEPPGNTQTAAENEGENQGSEGYGHVDRFIGWLSLYVKTAKKRICLQQQQQQPS